jgi:hypothetical protein
MLRCVILAGGQHEGMVRCRRVAVAARLRGAGRSRRVRRRAPAAWYWPDGSMSDWPHVSHGRLRRRLRFWSVAVVVPGLGSLHLLSSAR